MSHSAQVEELREKLKLGRYVSENMVWRIVHSRRNMVEDLEAMIGDGELRPDSTLSDVIKHLRNSTEIKS